MQDVTLLKEAMNTGKPQATPSEKQQPVAIRLTAEQRQKMAIRMLFVARPSHSRREDVTPPE
jgi:hypothetical protein